MRGSSPPSVLPADHPPIAATGGAPSAAPPADVPAFEAPAAWQAAPAGGMNRAAFRVAADGREAEVTISNVSNSAGPMFADPLAIANMWRSSVGLPEIAADQFGEVSESIEIGGRAATYVAIIPEPAQADPSRAAQATLGAMVRAGEQVWFFKMKGDRGLVTDMQGEFKTFLKSVRFATDAPETPPQAGGGKNDGND
jgi:hypothetical protein